MSSLQWLDGCRHPQGNHRASGAAGLGRIILPCTSPYTCWLATSPAREPRANPDPRKRSAMPARDSALGHGTAATVDHDVAVFGQPGNSLLQGIDARGPRSRAGKHRMWDMPRVIQHGKSHAQNYGAPRRRRLQNRRQRGRLQQRGLWPRIRALLSQAEHPQKQRQRHLGPESAAHPRADRRAPPAFNLVDNVVHHAAEFPLAPYSIYYYFEDRARIIDDPATSPTFQPPILPSARGRAHGVPSVMWSFPEPFPRKIAGGPLPKPPGRTVLP